MEKKAERTYVPMVIVTVAIIVAIAGVAYFCLRDSPTPVLTCEFPTPPSIPDTKDPFLVAFSLSNPVSCCPCPPGTPPGDCCFVAGIQWGNIETNDDRIYPLASVGGNIWWVAGAGIFPSRSSGQDYIIDGSYGKPGQTVKLFACLLSETYKPGESFYERPNCTLSSPDILIQTQ